MCSSQLPVTVRELIERLSLEPHPEGGWFRETHRSKTMIPRPALPEEYPGDRCTATSILFLLPTGGRSRPHRVRSEEIWLHQMGDDLALTMADSLPMEQSRRLVLGQGAGSELQAVVPGRWWQEAEALPGPAGFALVGCVVAPGFEFEDFQMAGP